MPRFSDSAASRAFLEHREVDAEDGVGRFGAGDRLEHEVDGRAARDGLDGGRHVRQHAALRRNVEAADDVVEHVEQIEDGRRVVAGRVDADDGVAAAEHQPVDDRRRDAAPVVGRMVRLQRARPCAP